MVDESEGTDEVHMEEPVAPGTTVEALDNMAKTGRVGVYLDGDAAAKGKPTATYDLTLKQKFQRLFNRAKGE